MKTRMTRRNRIETHRRVDQLLRFPERNQALARSSVTMMAALSIVIRSATVETTETKMKDKDSNRLNADSIEALSFTIF